MQPLTFYFNELSLPPDNIVKSDLYKWAEVTSILLSSLKKACNNHRDVVFLFQNNHWHADYARKPLSIWIKEWAGMDYYLWFLEKRHTCNQTENTLLHVYFNSKQTIGLSLAHNNNSWSFSFPIEMSPWIFSSIKAEYHPHNEDKRVVDIMHIACDQHVHRWQQKIDDWGRDVANNNTITTTLSGYLIKMYPFPKEHGHPHIHLEDPLSKETLAKFRIDKFCRLEGKPKWDSEIRDLINRYKDDLMLSWQRCQKGLHPYKL